MTSRSEKEANDLIKEQTNPFGSAVEDQLELKDLVSNADDDDMNDVDEFDAKPQKIVKESKKIGGGISTLEKLTIKHSQK